MKLSFKILSYVIMVVLLAVCSITIFRHHPEAQLAFMLPGVFILLFSAIRDMVYVNAVTRLRMAKGK